MAVNTRMSAEGRRLSIIESAMSLFAERGFRGVTTRELAAAVGVSEPILYQHFPSKRDLYAAIIEHKMESTTAVRDRLTALCAAPGEAEDFLRSLGTVILEWHDADHTFMRLLMLSGLENHELRDMVHERMFAHFFRLVVDTFARLLEAEGFRPVDPGKAAYMFLALLTMHSLDKMLFLHPLGDVSNQDLLDTVVDVYLCGIRGRKE